LAIDPSKIGFIHSFTVSAVNEVGEGSQSTFRNIIAGTVPTGPLNLVKVFADVT